MIERDFKLRTIISNHVDLISHDNRDRVDTLPTCKREHRMKKDCWFCRLQGNRVRVRNFRSWGGAQRGPRVQHGTVALLRMRPVELQG